MSNDKEQEMSWLDRRAYHLDIAIKEYNIAAREQGSNNPVIVAFLASQEEADEIIAHLMKEQEETNETSTD